LLGRNYWASKEGMKKLKLIGCNWVLVATFAHLAVAASGATSGESIVRGPPADTKIEDGRQFGFDVGEACALLMSVPGTQFSRFLTFRLRYLSNQSSTSDEQLLLNFVENLFRNKIREIFSAERPSRSSVSIEEFSQNNNFKGRTSKNINDYFNFSIERSLSRDEKLRRSTYDALLSSPLTIEYLGAWKLSPHGLIASRTFQGFNPKIYLEFGVASLIKGENVFFSVLVDPVYGKDMVLETEILSPNHIRDFTIVNIRETARRPVKGDAIDRIPVDAPEVVYRLHAESLEGAKIFSQAPNRLIVLDRPLSQSQITEMSVAELNWDTERRLASHRDSNDPLSELLRFRLVLNDDQIFKIDFALPPVGGSDTVKHFERVYSLGLWRRIRIRVQWSVVTDSFELVVLSEYRWPGLRAPNAIWRGEFRAE